MRRFVIICLLAVMIMAVPVGAQASCPSSILGTGLGAYGIISTVAAAFTGGASLLLFTVATGATLGVAVYDIQEDCLPPPGYKEFGKY